jgi:hypothetical protein
MLIVSAPSSRRSLYKKERNNKYEYGTKRVVGKTDKFPYKSGVDLRFSHPILPKEKRKWEI